MSEQGNPFAGTGGTGYDPDAVYSRATNQFNHGKTIKVTLPPEVIAQLEQWARARFIREYRSYQDVVRDAIHHHLVKLADKHGNYEAHEALARERLQCQIDQSRRSMMEADELIANTEEVLREYEKRGLNDEIIAFADAMETMDLGSDLTEDELAKLRGVVGGFVRRAMRG